MRKTKIKVKSAILSKLKNLNHQSIGMIADFCHTQPQTVISHIRNNAPTLLRADYIEIIKEVLYLNPEEVIFEKVEDDQENKHSVL